MSDKDTQNGTPRPWLDIPITQAGLSPRATRALLAAGYDTLAQAAAAGPTRLGFELEGFGFSARTELVRAIRQHRNAYARERRAAGLTLEQVGQEMGVRGEAVRSWLVEKSVEK